MLAKEVIRINGFKTRTKQTWSMILADYIPDNSKNRNRNDSKQNFLLGFTFYF